MSAMTLLIFVAGLVVLIGGAEVLVRGASRLAIAAGISPLVVGLTVVAYGTSAPELAVTVQAAFSGQPDLAVGNVVGSNISNILLILGISALAAPLVVSHQLVRLDVPLMIGVFATMYVMSLDGRISRLEGIILTSGAIAYTIFAITKSRKETKRVREEYERSVEGLAETEERAPGRITMDLVLVVGGILLLGLGSRWLIQSATVIAAHFGISELIVGLTIVAVGTSLPELATSVIASIRGERDIAVGNVVGSNLFNVLSVLGFTAIVAPTAIEVPQAALSFDIPVMIAVGVACLPIFFAGYRIDRWEGGFFLFYYAAYTGYLVLKATQHDTLPLFSRAMAFFMIPITLVTLAVITARKIHRQQLGDPSP